LDTYPHFRAWIARVQAQPGFLATVHPDSETPHSEEELPRDQNRHVALHALPQ
jgi:glutathione S-transferase